MIVRYFSTHGKPDTCSCVRFFGVKPLENGKDPISILKLKAYTIIFKTD
jgi:hypothetical protein